MSTQRANNLFICSSFEQAAGFYQQLLSGITTNEALGNRVLRLVRTARAFRQTERVRELSRILIAIPIREYQLIGRYHLVWCEFRESKCNSQDLETVIDQTETYKSKALITRATFELYGGKSKTETALYFYGEALAARPTMSDYIGASRGIALVKSMEGCHASALNDLERLVPLLGYAGPANYYDVLNSYAVELIEAKRLTEAEQVSLLVVSSPLAPYYPEWRETREDISERRASRATVTFSAATIPETRNLLHMPVCERRISPTEPFTAQQRAAVFDMQAWKNRKMTNKDERPPKPVTSEEKQARLKELEKLHGREILVQIMSALGDESVGDDSLRKALAVLEGLDED